jgi:ABC-type antimicrobial peptide transport system permease subunit
VNFWRLALRGLAYHGRINAAVGLGVVAATAVLTGALLVGDSVRGSLRARTLDRLGLVDQLLLVDRFFRSELVAELASHPRFPRESLRALGLMVFPEATVEHRGAAGVQRATHVLAVGSPSTVDVSEARSFWSLEPDPGRRPQRLPQRGEIVVNQALADELQVRVGDSVTLRLPKPQDIPPDSPLGEKTDRIRSFPRLTVIEVLPGDGLAQFSLSPRQTVPANAFVSLEMLQEGLEQPARINSIFLAGPSREQASSDAVCQAVAAALNPTLEDLGLGLTQVTLRYTDPQSGQVETIYDYFSLTTQQMVLPPEVAAAAARAFTPLGGQKVFTYLANLLERAARDGEPDEDRVKIPYSTVTGIDASATFCLRSATGQELPTPGPDEIILTDWAADELGAVPGDLIQLTYYEPETTHGVSVERHVPLRLAAVTPLTPPERPFLPARQLRFNQRPTVANDPALTPEVEGITDQKSINDWEVPFTIDYSLIREQDDVYWEDYGTTPKAYVSWAAAQRLWGSRFGQVTSYRIPVHEGVTRERLARQLREELMRDGTRLGFEFRPIKWRQLTASAGNTPFDVLFLLLSFFVIAAAVLLIALLFRLGFEQRARQVGLLLALGWSVRRVRRLLIAEGCAVATLGSMAGSMVGAGYALLMLAALQNKSWWLGAVSEPFLEFYWTPRSLLLGFVAGVAVSASTIVLSVFQTRRVSARQLLSGATTSGAMCVGRAARWPLGVVLALALLALGLVTVAAGRSGQEQAGAFVGAGATILAALLLLTWTTLRAGGQRLLAVTGRWPLVKLAVRSAARHPGRSTLTIGLIATSSFLIVAMSAFQLQPTVTGTGGFALVGESSQPLLGDLNDPATREELLGPDAAQWDGTRVFALRVRAGDDASCGNLYRATQPRILGVPPALVAHWDSPSAVPLPFSAAAAERPADRSNPWHLLADEPTPSEAPIPVIIDQETAMYSLRLYGGIGELVTFQYDGRPITFRVVGLLRLSILHGNLLISEADFRRLFPAVSGYRYFLIDTPRERAAAVQGVLEDRLGDLGFDATDSLRILAGLMALQNTYLRTFQSLGALGLLLGTFGLAAVQLRSVLERRGEMGILRAAGFRRRRLAGLVLLENVLLLLAGLVTGVLAAGLAVLPQLAGRGAAVPWQSLTLMLLVILLAGVAAGAWATRLTLRVPVLAALREER